jgi:ketosteroid isomerase-like protein
VLAGSVVPTFKEVVMTRTVIAVLAIAVFFPLAAQAGEWTAEQKELWDFAKACSESKDLEQLMACFHEDYTGWAIGLPVPANKADREAFTARRLEISDPVWVHLKPLAIKMHGNVAVLNYVATYGSKNKKTGEETTITALVTDICLKEDGKWTWIADHATLVEND